MPLTSKVASLFAVTLLMCVAHSAAGQAGSLDPSFGTKGIVATSLRSAAAVALQSDGKIVLAGAGIFNNGISDTLIRLNTDGSLDNSFGTSGVANFAPSGAGAAGNGFFAIGIQPNGEIVAAEVTTAEVQGGYESFVQVVRVESNGTLDTSFGSGGFTATTAIVFTPYNVTGTRALALALQSNGSILVASSYSNLMARFTNSGQLDTTFGSGGLVNLANQGPNTSFAPMQIVVAPSGKILVASGTVPPIPLVQAGTITLYSSNGSLDSALGSAGTVASVASPSALLQQADGKVVAAGSLTSKLNLPPASSAVGFGVVRYTASGILDKSFGKGGVAVADFGTNAPLSGAFAVAVQSNGELVAGGAAAQGPFNLSFNSPFALARFTTSGVLDTSFGSGGLVTTTLATGDSNVYSYVNGLAIQSDGKIVAAGNTLVDQGFGAGTGAYVARYLAH